MELSLLLMNAFLGLVCAAVRLALAVVGAWDRNSLVVADGPETSRSSAHDLAVV
jgi:hypothetical protein